MADIDAIKIYFKKIQRIITFEGDIKLFGKVFVKKGRLDDIMCCLLASMPDSYKNFIKAEFDKKLPSVNSFRILYVCLRQKTLFSANHYSVDADKANKLISAIYVTLETDINYAENNRPTE